MHHEKSIDYWLHIVCVEFESKAPDLLELFLIYAEEARFGRTYINSDLEALPKTANILEVGAGSLLLSCQLIREGYHVTSLEPTGSGFSHFDRMKDIVLNVANRLNIIPSIIDSRAESLTIRSTFDYAFSINVMEHVDDVQQVLGRVGESLCDNAVYRFTCPNYLFPYEPHFNIPTFFSKKITEKFFYNKIFGHSMPDPKGTWESLNWITVPQVKKIVKLHPSLRLTIHRSMLTNIFSRVVTDKALASRRSPLVVKTIQMIVFLRLHILFSIIPASIQPAMDCVVIKAGFDR